ncbi:SRPBCC family protein [Leifsonia sp. NPDC058230]|uniref:SRPBCC family protein n=1 Tax=Leifsonia sp. NPDC058230 TaxID=3346391 RepID=UPI0036DA7B31
MSVNLRRVACTPEQIFVVLADPWVYPTWVVGASRMRAADTGWPEPGTKLHHSIGVWPFVLNDETRVDTWDAPHRVVLEAKTRPVGRERVIIEVEPQGHGCLVRIEEYVLSGPLLLIPQRLLDVVFHIRNAETLRRLAHVAKGRAAEARAAMGRAVEGRAAEGRAVAS